MKVWSRVALVATAAGAVVAGAISLVPQPVADAANPEQLPDIRTVIPTDAFSVVNNTTVTPAVREFRYTHLVYDAGPGPLEIQPSYDSVSGSYRGMQQIFGKDSTTGQWSETREIRVPDTFVFHAEHGHFHFPLASFGLYKVAADGGIGAPAAISPKNGFCIDDSYIYNNSVQNAGTFIGSRGSCADPSSLRGISVGGADEYDYRDPGQAVPIDNLSDGTYWFKAVTDPYNDFAEANEANNETDVKVTIAGGKVTPGEVRQPDTTPPTGVVSAPGDASTVRDTTPITVAPGALTGGATVASVVFLLDGNPIGTATTAPYTMNWDTTTVVDGTHWLAARITDSLGRTGTTPVNAVTVVNSGRGGGNLALVGSVSVEGNNALTTPALANLAPGDRLVALVSTDSDAAGQAATVTGSSLSWSLVKRSNSQPGTSEIWTATLPNPVPASVQATITPPGSGKSQSSTLLAFRGAGSVGASAVASGATGAPSVSLSSTVAGSLVYAVGNDWDGATARTVPTGQSIVHQWVASAVGDTFWAQTVTSPTGAVGTKVTVNDTAPTDHRWNYAAVEVVPQSTGTGPTGDTSPPVVNVTDPKAGATVAGPIRLAATAADNVGVTKVVFKVDGKAVGTSTAPPFTVDWDSTTVAKGTHQVTAEASDAANNVGVSPAIAVNVDNSGPAPATIAIDTKVVKTGTSSLASPALTTKAAGEQVLAFVAFDGSTSAQTATVTGGGLTWTLVKRSNTQAGTSEIWSATAAAKLTNQVITAKAGLSGYDGQLVVMAFQNASGTGVASAAAAPSGAPSIYLPGVKRGSWTFTVGNDWDGATARTLAADQTLQQQWLDTKPGDTFWVQSMKVPNPAAGLNTMADTAPTNHRWNMAAVEVQASTG